MNCLGNGSSIFRQFQKSTNVVWERLHEALDFSKAPINSFHRLAWGRAHESIDDDDLATLLQKLLTKEDGIGVVLDILKMRFHQGKEEVRTYSDSLVAAAQRALIMHPFNRKQRQQESKDDCLGYHSKEMPQSIPKHLRLLKNWRKI